MRCAPLDVVSVYERLACDTHFSRSVASHCRTPASEVMSQNRSLLVPLLPARDGARMRWAWHMVAREQCAHGQVKQMDGRRHPTRVRLIEARCYTVVRGRSWAAVPPARLAHVSCAPRLSPFARRAIVVHVMTPLKPLNCVGHGIWEI